jgi:hypothetical protein
VAYPPAVADFQEYFVREFVYGAGKDKVGTADIQRALNEAGIDFNPGLWDATTPVGTTTEASIAHLYLAAHFLWRNLDAAGGLSAVNLGAGVLAAGSGALQSVGVGGVSTSFVIPAFVSESPFLLSLTKSKFGQAYLEMLEPRLAGNGAVVSGGGWRF